MAIFINDAEIERKAASLATLLGVTPQEAIDVAIANAWASAIGPEKLDPNDAIKAESGEE